DVKAVVEIQLDPGFHIYHGPTAKEMGPPEAVGTPTTFEFTGEGFEWSAPRFPEPTREEQDFGATKTFIFEHSGTPRVWFRGDKMRAADLSKLWVKVAGLTGAAAGGVPYGETVTNSGAGSDKLFAKFPADLTLAAAAAAGAPGAGGAAKPPPLDATHAHATLF